jgi:hypothetical protein
MTGEDVCVCDRKLGDGLPAKEVRVNPEGKNLWSTNEVVLHIINTRFDCSRNYSATGPSFGQNVQCV